MKLQLLQKSRAPEIPVVPWYAVCDPLRAKRYQGAICPHCGQNMALRLEVTKRRGDPMITEYAEIIFRCTGNRKRLIWGCGLEGTVEYPHWEHAPFYQPTRKELEEMIFKNMNGEPSS